MKKSISNFKLSPLALVFTTSLVLTACGGGSAPEPVIVEKKVYEPPQSGAKLLPLISALEGVEFDASDALEQLPIEVNPDDVGFTLKHKNGVAVDIETRSAGKWYIQSHDNQSGEVELELTISLGELNWRKSLRSWIYEDVDAARQVFSFIDSLHKVNVLETDISLPLAVKQYSDKLVSGAAIRVHYNSEALKYQEAIVALENDHLVSGIVFEDSDNFDNDATTDKFVFMSWLQGRSEGWSVPSDGQWKTLADLRFKSEQIEHLPSKLAISTVDRQAGVEFVSVPVTVIVE